jgi:RND family efflux transporter MFP subunit
MRTVTKLALISTVLLACKGKKAGVDATANEDMAVGTESIVVVAKNRIESGPRISGSLEPRDQAAVRAEIGGSILAVSAEPGQAVGRGQPLARIEDRTARDALLSAQSQVRSAEQAFNVAQRNAERMQTLSKAGAVADRDLEVAVNGMASARAMLDDARSRLASAQKMVENTAVRSPIAGVVSTRPVNAGDVVSPGTLLFNIVDPSSMRLTASVPSEQLGSLAPGMKVQFEVRGYPGRVFEGQIDRISPTADPVTRQIPIWVNLPNRGGTLVAGLFAEGRVATESHDALTIPLSAVEMGNAPTVLRLKGGKAQTVPVGIGIRDDANDRVEITAGLAAGDTILIGAARTITPGTPVRVGPAPESAPAPVKK